MAHKNTIQNAWWMPFAIITLAAIGSGIVAAVTGRDWYLIVAIALAAIALVLCIGLLRSKDASWIAAIVSSAFVGVALLVGVALTGRVSFAIAGAALLVLTLVLVTARRRSRRAVRAT
ncbi:MAG: hypothetical protein WAK00_02035 [Microbacterium sp.]